MKLIPILTEATRNACRELFDFTPEDAHIQLQLTSRDFAGQMTLVVFPFVKHARKSPEQCGEAIGNWFVANVSEVVGFNVVKGFLNLEISDAYWLQSVKEVIDNERHGMGVPNSKPLVLVEFASPNTNKPLHLGHLRNIFLGDSVASLLEAAGHSVKRVQIINDRGIHICKSMVAWKRFGNGETPESSGLKGDKLVGKYYVAYDKQYKAEVEDAVQNGVPKEQAEKEAPILLEAQEMLRAWEQKEPEVYALWEKMNGWVYDGFDVTYDSLGVSFDKLYYESETYLFGKEEVERGLSKEIFYRKEDGSIWVNLEDVGLDRKLLLRSDGTAVYITQDIGTAIQRTIDFPKMSQMVYTVGNEQEYHFKVLFAVLSKLGYPWASQCHHLSYGMVELPEGKMKSREGTVVDADDLVEGMTDTAREISEELGKLEELSQEEREQLYSQIGGAALKYFLLKVDARKNMLFNPRESIDFNGNTGPFIQYAHARISSLLRKAADVERTSSGNLQLSESEQNLALKLDRFPVVIEESAAKYSPAELANYLYDLVKDFNSFYQSMPVLKEENVALRTFRLELTEACGRVIRTGLGMLGIAAPERM